MGRKQFRKSNFVNLWLKMAKSRRRKKLNIIKDRRRQHELCMRRLWGGTLLCELCEMPTVYDLPEMLIDIWSIDSKLQLFATRRYRLLLSSDCCPSIDGIIRGRVIPRLVHFLSWGEENQRQLQIESASILANIGRKRPREVLDNGGYELFVKLLGSQHYELRVQALWGLGNLAELSPKWRDSMLSSGALDQVLNLLKNAVAKPVSNLSLLKAGSRTLAKFCKGRVLNFDQGTQVIQTARVLLEVYDEEVISHVCWILVYRMYDKDNFRGGFEVYPTVLRLLEYPSSSVLIPALRLALIILTTRDDYLHENFLERALPSMHKILLLNFPNLERELSKLLTIIATMEFPNMQGRQGHKILIDTGILDKLVELVSADIEKGVDDEVVMTLYTVATRATFMEVSQLAAGECLNLLVQLAETCKDPKIVRFSRKAIYCVMIVVNGAGRSCTRTMVSRKWKFILK